MNANASIDRAATASALAYVVAGNGFVDEHELDVLESQGAFAELAMDRRRFADLVRARLAEIDGSLREHSWLPEAVESSFDAVLDAVRDGDQRCLVCRLALAMCAAEHHRGDEQRMLVDHMLAHWRIVRETLDQNRGAGGASG